MINIRAIISHTNISYQGICPDDLGDYRKHLYFINASCYVKRLSKLKEMICLFFKVRMLMAYWISPRTYHADAYNVYGSIFTKEKNSFKAYGEFRKLF